MWLDSIKNKRKRKITILLGLMQAMKDLFMWCYTKPFGEYSIHHYNHRDNREHIYPIPRNICDIIEAASIK
jgi:hypothetical protein